MPLINQISQGRWDSFLSKIFGIKERSVAPTVGTELMPVVVVQTVEPEGYFLRGEQKCGGIIVTGCGNSTDPSQVWIANPRDSNKLVIVDEIRWFPMPDNNATFDSILALEWRLEGGFGVNLWPDASYLGGVSPPITQNGGHRTFTECYRDLRWKSNLGGNLGMAAQLWDKEPGELHPIGMLGTTVWEDVACVGIDTNSWGVSEAKWQPECILNPGSILTAQVTFVSDGSGSDPPINAIVMKVLFKWRERPLEDSERRPGAS